MGNRKKIESEILRMMDAWVPGSGNRELYVAKFKAMSDSQFEQMMKDFRDGTDVLRAVLPNGVKNGVTVEHNIKIAKTMGHSFLERIWLTSEQTGQEYLTPQRYLVLQLPLRRQVQLLFKKISVPKNNDSVDHLTGQATGRDSKGSSITAPEAQILYSLGLTSTIEETMKIRGGDRKAMDAFDKAIINEGKGDIEQAKLAGGTVKANDALAMYLNGLHISNQINK